MRNIKKIFTLVLSLILLFAVSCSNDDKTGVKNNPPENDTEITDGEMGSGSSSGGSSETGTGGSGTETGGGSGTGTGGDSGSGSGSGESGGGTETPPTPSEPKIVTIDAKDFPTELLGRYKDDKLASSGFSGYNFETEVSTITKEGIQKTQIEGSWLQNGITPAETQRQVVTIEKWKKTTKGGNPIKLEGEYVNGGEKYTIIYDYASKTLIGTCVHPDVTALFNGKKIS